MPKLDNAHLYRIQNTENSPEVLDTQVLDGKVAWDYALPLRRGCGRPMKDFRVGINGAGALAGPPLNAVRVKAMEITINPCSVGCSRILSTRCMNVSGIRSKARG